jgi:hypothetical protein
VRLWPATLLSAWLEGQRGLSPPWKIPLARARCDSASGPVGRPAVPSGARAGVAGRAHTGGVEENVRRDKVREADKVAPPVIGRKGKPAPVGLTGCSYEPAELDMLGRLLGL